MTSLPGSGIPPSVPPSTDIPKFLDPGDDASVPTKKPWESTSTWGLLLAGVTALCTWLANKHYLPEAMIPFFQSAVVEWLGVGAGIVVAYYGRHTAVVPLSLFGRRKLVTMPDVSPATPETPARTFRTLLFLVPLFILTTGCASTPPLVQTQLARRTYVDALAVMTPLVKSPQNPTAPWDPSAQQRRMFVNLRKEVRGAIDDAERQAVQGGGSPWKFNSLMSHANKLLVEFLRLKFEAKTAAVKAGAVTPAEPQTFAPIERSYDWGSINEYERARRTGNLDTRLRDHPPQPERSYPWSPKQQQPSVSRFSKLPFPKSVASSSSSTRRDRDNPCPPMTNNSSNSSRRNGRWISTTPCSAA